MMLRQLPLIALALLLLLVAACAPSREVPTVMVLDAMTTEQVATATAAALATFLAPPTLPPTWTPSPVLSPTPEALAETTSPAATGPQERLVFVANGAFWSVNVDGTGLAPLTGAVGARDLALSPDGRRVAFIAPGPGSALEVFVLNLGDATVRQVTSLGFADVVDPSWHPDGSQVIFAAGRYQGQEREVYTVRPDGQSLRQLTTLAMPGLSDPIFTPDGNGILFAAPGLMLMDLASGDRTTLTVSSGSLNDSSPRFRPGSDQVVYIELSLGEAGYPGGPLRYFDLNTFNPDAEPPTLVDLYVQSFVFAASGQWLAFTSHDGVYLVDFDTMSSRQLTGTGGVLPRVAISPNSSRIAYLAGNTTGGGAPQLVISGRAGRDPRVVADVAAQEVGDLLWVAAN